ncbi:hypothetical protein N7450_004034 [Penicillium hetheringtonii]|uniref:Transcription factor TFIIIC triple barrel domain-containing protein n=1 Tax=Penicillium hetheringtonii TaxID=911720 RepID=A0AAD6DPA1_9EURO|nr:hypothetical protein N7450_004034 [Penicillium hetheringtonii]
MEIDSHSTSDSEYEYEYHPTETETFYLNLDLTSHQGPIRPPRRRQEDKPKESYRNDDSNNPIDAFTPLDSAEDSHTRERIQILGLHTCNPIISYHNQIFSCSWSDQIGTELIFAHPETDPDMDPSRPTPLHAGPAFELLAANSVKILGRKANLTSNNGQQGDALQNGSGAGAGFGSAGPSSIPGRPGPGLSQQAQFIQKLQALKERKGETDTVRTVYRLRRNVDVAERLSAWAKTEAQLADVRKLKERAGNGDLDAIEQLEGLFRSYCEEQDDEDSDEEMEEDEEVEDDEREGLRRPA